MAFQPGFVKLTLEVRPAPGAFLSSDPVNLAMDQGDVASFVLTAAPKNGFAGPIFLRLANMAGGHAFSVNPIPAGGGKSNLTIDANLPVGVNEIDVEALDALPPGEEPVGPDGLTAD